MIRGQSLGKMISLNAVLLLFGMLTILPFMYMLSTSLLSDARSLGNSIYLVPVEFNFINYVRGWQYVRMGTAFQNSLFVVIVSGILQLVITMMAAFPLARKKIPGGTFIKFFFFGTLLIPFQAILLPTLILLRDLGLKGNLWGVILPALCDAFTIFVFVGFFQGIPREIEESAIIDGCSEIKTLLYMYIPLSKASIATLALFHFLGVWNDVVLPALLLSGTLEKLTLAPLMTLFLNTGGIPMTKFVPPTPNVKAACIMINVIPILILYGFLQNNFRQGITLGALKG
jgi:putative aldouronate transport system permease protein